jgi:dATP pyrophosphohydrolase
MARAPFQVLVYPYRPASRGSFEYALLSRSDAGWWQGVAGGGEDNETPLDAAHRETHEETGIRQEAPFIQLDTVAPVPVTEFRDSYLWGEKVYVIPQYYFGVLAADSLIAISREHTEYQWLAYKEARNLMKYETDKTALWELDRKLWRLGPRD